MTVTNGPSNSWRANIEEMKPSWQHWGKQKGIWQQTLVPTSPYLQILTNDFPRPVKSLLLLNFLLLLWFGLCSPLVLLSSLTPAQRAGGPSKFQLPLANTDTNSVLKEGSPRASTPAPATAPARNLKPPPSAQLQPCICTGNRRKVKKWFSK